MKMIRLLAAACLTIAASASAFAQAPEKPKLTLGVGGKALLYYLPLTIAERKGYFKEQGLDVEILADRILPPANRDVTPHAQGEETSQ